MNIVFAMILSIGIKAVSAVVEIVIQMLITNNAGVSELGNYTFYVSLIEGGYFLLFSGSIKLNTYYLSTPSSSLSGFKKKYNLFYVLPLVSIIAVAFALMHSLVGVIASFVLLLYYFAFDESSLFFSRGHQLSALLGEYLFGRIVLLIGVLSVVKLGCSTGMILLILYGLQFPTMLIWFLPFKRRIANGSDEIRVPTRKLVEYQVSDVATSLITYFPTILQYIFGGAFTAGFAGIVTLVKKFINFISGPTAKVFLPEFSRLYKNGEREKLENVYLMIVRIQMVFIGTIAAVLIGYPKLILHMFSPELEQYQSIFTWTAVSLLVIAGIGPVTGMLQMTGNERICNRNQWVSIGAMLIVCLLFHKEQMFAVYGLCAQAIIEGGLKYYSVCRWFKKNVIPISNYLLLWLPVGCLKVVVNLTGWDYSRIGVLVSAFIIFSWNTLFALRDPLIRNALVNKIKKTDR